MFEEIYTIHRYDGHAFELTLKEIFTEFRPSVFLAQFGYGSDFGKYIANFSRGNFCFSEHDANKRVYFDYLFFITNRKGKLMQPEQILAEYCQKYDPTNYWYTGYYRRYTSTGRKRRGGHCYRRVQTTAERRAACAVLKEEGEPEFRGRRRNVPNAWDDIHLPFTRSWKKQSKRKKQYKGS